MSIQILTKNGVDNTNIDGARANHFNAGQRSGIVKGAFNEGLFTAVASNIIALDTCELRICGHQIVIDSVQSITLTNRPATPTRYSMIAQILVDSSSVPTFSLFIQPSSIPLIQNNLFSSSVGNGIYQIEIGRFTLDTTGTISDVVRTADIITGASENGYDYINIGEVTTTMVASGIDAEVDIENVEVDGEKQTNFHFSIPETAGTAIDINGVQQSSLSFNSDPQTQITNNATNIDKKIDFTQNQNLTTEQKLQARTNIGAVSSNDLGSKADLDAQNLSGSDVTSWQSTLGVTDKADKDAANLGGEDAAAWKTALGMGSKADTDASNLSSANITSWQSACGFERVDTVYDMSSNDASINWGFTSGIASETPHTTIGTRDFSPYKKLRVYAYIDGSQSANVYQIMDVDLTSPANANNDSYRNRSVASMVYSGGAMVFRTMNVSVGRNKDEFYWWSHVKFNDQSNNNSASFVYRIEGVK